MRDAITIPDQWKIDGVWYFPDVDDNQKKWRRYRALSELERELRPTELEELEELEVEVDGLFKVRIAPYSYGEYQATTKKIAEKALGKKKNVDELDSMGLGERIASEVCKKRILEVSNYRAGKQAKDGTVERWMVETGEELVEFITKAAGEEEMAVIEDIFKAIKNRSHLDAGQKKTFSRSPSSSPTGTPA